MSSLIENAARGAKSLFPGVGKAQDVAAAQDARGTDLIKQLAIGGASLGGGAGLAVVLANYLKSMRQEQELDDESRINDDTLYIPLQNKAAADMNRWLAPGVAVTGGLLASGGAYALTQAVYNALQKRHRQKLLDEAQNEALAAADLETTKAAAEMTFADLVTAFPVAVPLLAALASGGVAYAALDKTFPVVDRPKSKFPKRIRAVAPSGATQTMPVPSEGPVKMASAFTDDACTESANEFLMLFVSRVADAEKRASFTSELLNRVANEGVAEPRLVCHDFGLATLCESIKGAQCDDQMAKLAAAAVIARDPFLGPVAAHLAAAEFIDRLPNVARICASMDRDQLDKMAGLGVLLHEGLFRPSIIEKSAASVLPPALLQDLMAALQSRPEAQSQEPMAAPVTAPRGGNIGEELDAALTTDLSGSMAENAEGDQDENPEADEESHGKDDAIDSFIDNPAQGI